MKKSNYPAATNPAARVWVKAVRHRRGFVDRVRWVCT